MHWQLLLHCSPPPNNNNQLPHVAVRVASTVRAAAGLIPGPLSICRCSVGGSTCGRSLRRPLLASRRRRSRPWRAPPGSAASAASAVASDSPRALGGDVRQAPRPPRLVRLRHGRAIPRRSADRAQRPPAWHLRPSAFRRRREDARSDASARNSRLEEIVHGDGPGVLAPTRREHASSLRDARARSEAAARDGRPRLADLDGSSGGSSRSLFATLRKLSFADGPVLVRVEETAR